MATTVTTNYDRDTMHHRDVQAIERDIEQTRHEMDETLGELGERLHPKHLLDYVLDYFRSTSGDTSKAALDQARDLGSSAAHQVRKHPMPFALMGAGALWWILEGDKKEGNGARHWSSSKEPTGTYGMYGHPELEAEQFSYGAWKQEPPAWHPAYDWSQTEQDERTWTDRARSSLDNLKSTLKDSSKSATEKVQHAAASVLAASGKKRREIHARWANLREHSGSFVDARTGEPYDETYGREWRNLLAADHLAECGEEEAGWREKAERLSQDLQQMLSQGTENVKETFRGLAAKLGTAAEGTSSATSGYARSAWHGATGLASRASSGAADVASRASLGATHLASRATSGATRLAEGTRDMGSRMIRQTQHGVRSGYDYTRHQVADSVEQYPLGAALAALGLGLVAGFVAPRSRTEDRWMGETSDELKERAKDTAQRAYESGKEVASATASAAMEEAERQGLTPSQLGEKAREAFRNVEHVAEDKLSEATRTATEKTQHAAHRAKDASSEAARTEAIKQQTSKSPSIASNPKVEPRTAKPGDACDI